MKSSFIGVRLLSRTLTVLFRRDSDRDRQDGKITFAGYKILWPDGNPVGVGLNAFCTRGQRLLGLNRFLADCEEWMIEIVCIPLSGMDDQLTRLPGHRVRRFYLERHGATGRLHFMDGTPTETAFELGRDEPSILDWVGLATAEEGGKQWLDIATRATEVTMPLTASA